MKADNITYNTLQTMLSVLHPHILAKAEYIYKKRTPTE